MSFNQEPTDEEFFNAMNSATRSKSSSNNGTNESFTVYNPVEDSFEGWPHGTFEDANTPLGADNDAAEETFHENSELHTDNNVGPVSPSRSNVNNVQDDALARAIAEQDLPPGVSAVEQQEIMMRLLTQQLRRGDESGEGVSPELEQRLRE
jgi:hypothetical protein